MSGSDTTLREAVRLQRAGQRCVLASPARLEGSLPCSGQSRLVLREDGTFIGTVGGGLLEAEVLRRAADVIKGDEPVFLEFELTQDDAADAGMICGGACTILLEPVRRRGSAKAFAAAAACEAEGADAILVTAFPRPGVTHKLVILPAIGMAGTTGDATTDTWLRDAAEHLSPADQPRMLDHPFRVCFQPLCFRPTLFIFGAGHVALPVEQIARLAGFRTIVVDDRADFASAARFPEADHVLAASVDDAFREMPVDSGGFVVAITRGHALDEEVVAHALRTPARYIGMIGSKRKVATVLARLRERGFSDADLDRIHAPIGLRIGAETVEEIAVSIVAELIAVRRG